MLNNLSSSIRKTAWGYVFLYFNINLGTLDILPAWAGYMMILSAIPILALYEESAGLLRNMALFLTGWSAFDWVMTIFGANAGSSGTFYSLYALAGTVVSVAAIYFHFQLLTNLAGVAVQLGFEDRSARFLRLRTINTVMQTILAVYTAFPVQEIMAAAIALLIANLIVLIMIVVCLFGFRKEINEQRPSAAGPTL